MKRADDEPGREEFLKMLQLCSDDKDLEGPLGDDARRYLNSNRCAALCRKYLTRVENNNEGGMSA